MTQTDGNVGFLGANYPDGVRKLLRWCSHVRIETYQMVFASSVSACRTASKRIKWCSQS